MLKRPITYTNFNDEEVTEDFYFNLSNKEMIKMQAAAGEGGLEAYLTSILKSNNPEKLMAEFERIILSAYGEKSEDGRHFFKSDEIRERFANSAAFDALYFELCTKEDAVIEFIKGVMPKELMEKLDQAKVKDDMAKKLSVMPPPPSPPMPT